MKNECADCGYETETTAVWRYGNPEAQVCIVCRKVTTGLIEHTSATRAVAIATNMILDAIKET